MRLIPGPADVLSAATTLTQGASRAAEDVADLFSLVGRGVELMDRAEDLLTAAEDSLARADGVVARAEAELDRSGAVLDAAAERLARADALLAPVEALAADALPKLRAVSESVEPDELRALVALVDHLPLLVRRLEDDVLPVLQQLGNVGPDVTRILDSVTDLSHAILGLPGVERLQRRGERREEAEERGR